MYAKYMKVIVSYRQLIEIWEEQSMSREVGLGFNNEKHCSSGYILDQVVRHRSKHPNHIYIVWGSWLIVASKVGAVRLGGVLVYRVIPNLKLRNVACKVFFILWMENPLCVLSVVPSKRDDEMGLIMLSIYQLRQQWLVAGVSCCVVGVGGCGIVICDCDYDYRCCVNEMNTNIAQLFWIIPHSKWEFSRL